MGERDSELDIFMKLGDVTRGEDRKIVMSERVGDGGGAGSDQSSEVNDVMSRSQIRSEKWNTRLPNL